MSVIQRDIVIVGGGQAARRAAEGARAASPDATIAIVGEELHAPYERPPLSKEALESADADESSCWTRSVESYAADRIDLLLGRRVSRLDRGARQILTLDGDRVGYRRLILATGSSPRKMEIFDAIGPTALYLRTLDDARRLRPYLTPGRRVAVVGAGFIGLEVASSAQARGCEVTVLEAADRILARAVPSVVADRLLSAHRAAGIDIRLSSPVLACAFRDDAVELDFASGKLRADVVVIGIGVVPNSGLASEAGLEVDDGICCDENGATAADGIFVAGEVARHPVAGHDGAMRLESWAVAEHQAFAAGGSAAGRLTAHRAFPWFWTDQLGLNVQFLGTPRMDREPIVREAGPYEATLLWLDDANRLSGMVTLNCGADISAGRRIMSAGTPLDPLNLADPGLPLRRHLANSGRS